MLTAYQLAANAIVPPNSLVSPALFNGKCTCALLSAGPAGLLALTLSKVCNAVIV